MGLCVSEQADGYTYFYGDGKANHCLGTGILAHKGISSVVKWVYHVLY
jgi:hypothetical protein